MIYSFSCKNFYSFGELATLDFEVNDNAPQNNGYFKTESGSRLSKVETVIGPNASGKTNLLKVLPLLKWLIVDSFNINPEAPIPVKPFVFGKNGNDPTELSVTFEITGKVYSYAFTMNKDQILSEELTVTSFVEKKNSSKKAFSRVWNETAKKYDLDDSNFDLPKEFSNLLRTNATVIATAARLNHKESQEISKFWQLVDTNVVEAGWVGDQLFPSSILQMSKALKFFSENDAIKKEAEKLLARFDLGLNAFEILKKQEDNQVSLSARALHMIGGKEYPMNLMYESSGTKQLFILLKTILKALASGGVAVLDEFDVNLHPEMVLALFDLFIQPETNPNRAQLLFSTHNHLVLSKLDKYQIILVEKTEDGKSESWRLDEVSGIRADENYYSKYIAGAYGAVPKI